MTCFSHLIYQNWTLNSNLLCVILSANLEISYKEIQHVSFCLIRGLQSKKEEKHIKIFGNIENNDSWFNICDPTMKYKNQKKMNSQDFLRQSLNMCYLINQSKTWLFNANISQ